MIKKSSSQPASFLNRPPCVAADQSRKRKLNYFLRLPPTKLAALWQITILFPCDLRTIWSSFPVCYRIIAIHCQCFFANLWTTPICEKIILTIQYQHNHYFQCLVPFPCYQTVPTICPPHLWIYPNLQWKWFFVRHSGKILAPSVKWKTSLQLCYNLAKQQWCNHSAWSSPFYKVCGMPWSLMLDSIWVCFCRIY